MKAVGLSKTLVNFYWHCNKSQKTILEVRVFVYWFMNIAGIINESLDPNTVQPAYDGILKDQLNAGSM
jgi:hypothetical protein